MKKYSVLSAIGTVILMNSCSDDRDIINSADKKIVLNKVTTVYYDNPSSPETNIATFNYNNEGELIKIVSEGRTSTFEYDAEGKPKKTIYYNSAGVPEYYSLYTYNGEQLSNVKAVYSNPDFNRTISYTYENGKVKTSTLCQSADCSNPSTSSYQYSGDNISVETSVIGGTFSYATQQVFTYDNKPNPFTYTNKYFRISSGGAYILSGNNYLTEKKSYKDSAGMWIPNQNITYHIQYNSSNLPAQVTGKNSNGNQYVQYKYEYIIQ